MKRLSKLVGTPLASGYVNCWRDNTSLENKQRDDYACRRAACLESCSCSCMLLCHTLMLDFNVSFCGAAMQKVLLWFKSLLCTRTTHRALRHHMQCPDKVSIMPCARFKPVWLQKPGSEYRENVFLVVKRHWRRR
jgi:hypothetical protein